MQSRKLRACRSNCCGDDPGSLRASIQGSGLAAECCGPPVGWPSKTGMALEGSIFISGNTSYPARETIMLPLAPKNSRPKPARRPALASRIECIGGKARIFEYGVLRVGSLAIVLQGETSAAGGDRRAGPSPPYTIARCRYRARPGWSSGRRNSPRTSGNDRARGADCRAAGARGRATCRNRDRAAAGPSGGLPKPGMTLR